MDGKAGPRGSLPFPTQCEQAKSHHSQRRATQRGFSWFSFAVLETEIETRETNSQDPKLLACLAPTRPAKWFQRKRCAPEFGPGGQHLQGTRQDGLDHREGVTGRLLPSPRGINQSRKPSRWKVVASMG